MAKRSGNNQDGAGRADATPPARASRLYYTGGTLRGVGEHFPNVPARDLEEDDIARLSDERYAEITGAPPGRPPLYRPEPVAEDEAADPPAIVYGEPIPEEQLAAEREYEQRVLDGEVRGEGGANAPDTLPDEEREGPLVRTDQAVQE